MGLFTEGWNGKPVSNWDRGRATQERAKRARQKKANHINYTQSVDTSKPVTYVPWTPKLAFAVAGIIIGIYIIGLTFNAIFPNEEPVRNDTHFVDSREKWAHLDICLDNKPKIDLEQDWIDCNTEVYYWMEEEAELYARDNN